MLTTDILQKLKNSGIMSCDQATYKTFKIHLNEDFDLTISTCFFLELGIRRDAPIPRLCFAQVALTLLSSTNGQMDTHTII